VVTTGIHPRLQGVIFMNGLLRVPRSRGAFSGLLLLLLGAWGALIPFLGPYFHYAYTPDRAWVYTSGRLWMEILPGAAAALGGLILLVSAVRPMALMGAGLAAAGGAWFAVGTALSPLWAHASMFSVGSPIGGTVRQVAEHIGFFTGLGVVIVFLGAAAMGRLSLIGAREAMAMERAEEEPTPTRHAYVPADSSDREYSTR
jgi:hypothetical protein